MWEKVLLVNSIALIVATLFLVYAIGIAILAFKWHMLVIALVIFVVLLLIEIALNVLADS